MELTLEKVESEIVVYFSKINNYKKFINFIVELSFANPNDIKNMLGNNVPIISVNFHPSQEENERIIGLKNFLILVYKHEIEIVYNGGVKSYDA